MTVSVPGHGAITEYDPELMVGLEDVSPSDMVIPRIRIIGSEAAFQENLSNAKFEQLDCIILGLIKQRAYFHPVVLEGSKGDKPMCKSTDFETGYPNISEKTPPDRQFPWSKSNFDRQNFPENDKGQIVLPCQSCIFSMWEKGDWKTPPCAEQHTYVILYSPDGMSMNPALLTVQKSAIKDSKAYYTSFSNINQPMFLNYTTIKLEAASRGVVNYAIPKFHKGERTDSAMWKEYANTYLSIREFIRKPPRAESEENPEPVVSSNQNTAPQTPVAATANVATPPPAASPAAPPTVPTAPAQPAATPAPPAQMDDDDDMPF
jgi:hypothetical protein